MKKLRIFALLLALLLLLSACNKPVETPAEQPQAPNQNEPAQNEPAQIPEEPDQPDTPPEEEPDQPQDPVQEQPGEVDPPEVDYKTVYTQLLASLDPAALTDVEIFGGGDTWNVTSQKGLSDVVYILQNLTLTEPMDAQEPGAISMYLTINRSDGTKLEVTLPALAVVEGGTKAPAFFGYDYAGDVFRGLTDIGNSELVEEPFETPLEGGWFTWAEARENTVVLDEKGENIRLVAREDMTGVRLYRVTYDAQTGTSKNMEELHDFGDVETGQVLDFMAKTSQTLPELALEWTDIFGYKTRWLVMPVKLFSGGEGSQDVQLIYDRDPIRAQTLATGLNFEESKAIGRTDPYKYMTPQAKQTCVTEILLEQDVDLDGNGRMNTIQLLYVHDPEGQTQEIFEPEVYDGELGQGQYTLRILAGSARYDAKFTFSGDVSLFLADMDQNDQLELYACGNTGTDTWCTKSLQVTAEGLKEGLFLGDICQADQDTPRDTIAGEILQIQDEDLLILRTRVNMLGSYDAIQAYSADFDGTLSPFPGSRWNLEDPVTLTVKKELPVNKDGAAATLIPGTQLQIVQFTDSRAWFTAPGTGSYVSLGTSFEPLSIPLATSYIQLERANDGLWTINGASDMEYFESFPYTG